MSKKKTVAQLDMPLLLITLLLATIGFIMVCSSSIAIADKQYGVTYYFALRHLFYLLSGAGLGWLATKIPLETWETLSRGLLLYSFILLIVVLIPGVGREVNGSTRWLTLAGFTFQVSEFVKLATIIYMAGYIESYQGKLNNFAAGIMRPMTVVACLACLLLLQPDFGAVVVISATTLTMLFLAGVGLRHFAGIVCMTAILFSGIAVFSPYRWERLTAFMDPWGDQFNSGYQLTQALIAFGRGEWFGVGLGSSIQKLFYLPEAHNDFMFAVMGEELGLVGLLSVILLFVLLVAKAFRIAMKALQRKQIFAAYLAFGIAAWLSLQTLISMGVNTGLLPTKGLTLPLLSYGGSSLWITCIAIGLLFRIHHENSQSEKA